MQKQKYNFLVALNTTILSVPFLFYEVSFIYIHNTIKLIFMQTKKFFTTHYTQNVTISITFSKIHLHSPIPFDIIFIGTFNKLGGANLLTKKRREAVL